MGLDMYLYGVKYYSKYERDDNGNYVRDKTHIHKTEEIYWRKANAIHNWFVNNCQYGEDDCHPHEVTEEQLIELKNLCKQVIESNNLAKELLPTQSGFFFGSIEYDEYYFESLSYTIKQINELLNSNFKYDWYEYCSSW